MRSCATRNAVLRDALFALAGHVAVCRSLAADARRQGDDGLADRLDEEAALDDVLLARIRGALDQDAAIVG